MSEAIAPRICSIEDCNRPARKRGWCSAHYARWRTTGDIREGVPFQSYDPESYSAVHQRLHKERGPATDHRCCFCGEPATQWAYDRADADELTGVTTGSSTTRRVTVTYSLDLERYLPACFECHRRMDVNRPTHCEAGHPYTWSNTRRWVSLDGKKRHRVCRECQRIKNRARRTTTV